MPKRLVLGLVILAACRKDGSGLVVLGFVNRYAASDSLVPFLWFGRRFFCVRILARGSEVSASA